MMVKLRLDEAEETVRRGSRDTAETEKQESLNDRKPRRKRIGKTVPITFRTTPQKKHQILRLADRLSLSEDASVSITETIEMAIDVLEERLAGIRRQ
jgi:hypothetical protein